MTGGRGPGAGATRHAELLTADGFVPLPIDQRHALSAGGYPQPHRDPFDRMLAAQSEIESMVLVTLDPVFAAFGARTFW